MLRTIKKNPRRICLLLLLVLIICVCFVYGDFLTGKRGYVFYDIGADSYFQTYPQLVYGANYIRTEKAIPTWSFTAGMGMTLYGYYTLFDLPILLAGAQNVSFMMGLMQVVKVVLAGMLFYAYLRALGIGRFASAVTAVCYAFCGHMIVRGSWISYPNEVVCAALALLGFEHWFRKGKLWLFAPGLSFLFVTLQSYYVCLYLLLMMAYAAFRYWIEPEHGEKFGRYCTKVAGHLLLACGLSMVVLLPQLNSILHSVRTSSIGAVGQEPMGWKDLNLLIITYLRTLSSDILGVTTFLETNRGVLPQDFLSGPLFYCGLSVLLLIPQAFVHTSKRERIGYSVIVLCMAAYILLPAVRYACNGFMRTDFKLSSFWILLLCFYMSAHALDTLWRTGGVNKTFLVATGALILLPLAYLTGAGNHINRDIAGTVGLFILGYTILLLQTGIKRKKLVMGLFAILVVLEAVLFSGRLLSARMTMGDIAAEPFLQLYNYDDGTAQAVAYINAQDEAAFYRIDKTYDSSFLCDSLIQDYYGTASYQGGGKANHTKEIANFVSRLGGTFFFADTPQYINRLCDVGEIESLLDVRYMLSKASDYNHAGYKAIATVDGVTIYQNKNALPLGFMYIQAMDEETFEALSVEERQISIFNAIVLPEKDIEDLCLRKAGTTKTDVFEAIKQLRRTGYIINMFSDRQITGTISCQTDGVLFFSVPYDSGWRVYVDGKRSELLHANIGFMGTYLPAGEHTVELRYIPQYIGVGTTISMASLLAYLWFCIMGKEKRERLQCEKIKKR